MSDANIPLIQDGRSPEIACMKCSAKFSVVLPKPEINNQVSYSMLVLVHEHPMVCPNCTQRHTFTMGGQVNYKLAVIPLPDEAQQPEGKGGGNGKIIIPPAGAHIRRQ